MVSYNNDTLDLENTAFLNERYSNFEEDCFEKFIPQDKSLNDESNLKSNSFYTNNIKPLVNVTNALVLGGLLFLAANNDSIRDNISEYSPFDSENASVISDKKLLNYSYNSPNYSCNELSDVVNKISSHNYPKSNLSIDVAKDLEQKIKINSCN